MLCPACEAENGSARKFCRACGAAMAPVCRACGLANEPGDRFCGDCGASLTSAPPPATPAQPAPISDHLPTPEPLGSPARLADDPEEWRPVTVLFADIVGFTTLSERLDAESVREITTECFRRPGAGSHPLRRHDRQVHGRRRHGPVRRTDSPTRMTQHGHYGRHWRCIGRWSASTSSWSESADCGSRCASGSSPARLSPECETSAGVREYTVIGDAVNVAARLQAATEPSTILVGAATERRSGGAFAFRAVPTLVLKGKDQPVNAFVLLGPADPSEPERRRSSGVSRAPLVGRADELRELDAMSDRATPRSGPGRSAAGRARTRQVASVGRASESCWRRVMGPCAGVRARGRGQLWPCTHARAGAVRHARG